MNLLKILLLLVATLHGCELCFAGELPANDAGKNQLIIVGRPDVQPATWFESVPELKQTKNAVAFTLFSPDSKLFRERYQSVLGTDFPIVAYLKPNGAVVYFADRHSLPTNGSALLDEMKAAALAARNARPSGVVPNDLELNQLADCPEGNCYPEEQPQREPLFPRLRKNPLDSANEKDWLFGGVITDSIGSAIWLIGAVVAMCFVLLFVVIIAAVVALMFRGK
jgi:hypothetical protein